jgi:hypothetical protein
VQGLNGNSATTANLQGSSQVSFFKRPLSDNLNGLPLSASIYDKSQANTKTKNHGDPLDLDSSNQELQNTIGSGVNHSSARD